MKLVILDRDGVIDRGPGKWREAPEKWAPLPESLDGIAALNQSGYRVVVTSNLGPEEKGLDIDALNTVHRRIHNELEGVGGHVDGFFFCPHEPDEECDCRAPSTGLLLEIAERFGVPLEGVLVITSQRGGIEAARTVGATPLLVARGADSAARKPLVSQGGVPTYPDLKSAVAAILEPSS